MMRLASAKLLIEAPVNGGRNYKFRCSYVNKLGYMLETPVYPLVLVIHKDSSDNPQGADNQQERPAEHRWNPQRLHARLILDIKPDAVGLESDDIVRSP